MKTFLTTCPTNLHLLPICLKLLEKFYPLEVIVDVAEKDEFRSDQLRRLLQGVTDNYLIVLEEDFFFVRPVDLNLLEQVWKFCEKHDVDRFSLQSKVAYKFSDWPQTEHVIDNHRVYEISDEAFYVFSMEASIWKRSFLYNNLHERQNDPEIEIETSRRLLQSKTTYKVYALEHIVMHYRDAMRDGKQLIECREDPLQLVVKKGKEDCLYPLGNGSTELLL